MTSRPVHRYRRPPVRRYRKCRCPRGRSPLIDTFHTPVARWGFTLCALVAFVAELPLPFVVTAAVAAFAWRHR